jgi:hypothetical protein
MAGSEMRQRERECKHCGVLFTYPIGKGKGRVHCTATCRDAYQVENRRPRSTWPVCSTDGCGKTSRAVSATKCNTCYSLEIKRRAGKCSVQKCHSPATRVGHGLCEIHYYRVRNTGSFDLIPRVAFQTSHGYLEVKDPTHPLAKANGWVAQHRVVAHRKYGSGPHPCHWCGKVLDWTDLVVDHLNEVKDDNSDGNLVVACSPCNRVRGGMIPFIRRMLPDRVSEFVGTLSLMRCEEAGGSK